MHPKAPQEKIGKLILETLKVNGQKMLPSLDIGGREGICKGLKEFRYELLNFLAAFTI